MVDETQHCAECAELQEQLDKMAKKNLAMRKRAQAAELKAEANTTDFNELYHLAFRLLDSTEQDNATHDIESARILLRKWMKEREEAE